MADTMIVAMTRVSVMMLNTIGSVNPLLEGKVLHKFTNKYDVLTTNIGYVW